MLIATLEIGEEKTEFFLKQCLIWVRPKPRLLPSRFWNWLWKRFFIVLTQEVNISGVTEVTWAEYNEDGKTRFKVLDVKFTPSQKESPSVKE